ncbi:MAG: fasciclin domain-containing protein [Candidatus Nanopelagicales bacterium]|jgi:uncharacterized surface protein with fasciclin (FAS1) repeats
MRLTRKIAALAAGSALVVGSVLATAPAANAAAPNDPTGGAQVVAALEFGYGDGSNGNPYDFQILTTALKATGLDATLKTLDNITIFAPNDRAFEVLAKSKGLLGPNYRFGATVDEDKVVAALLTLPNPVQTISAIVLYHVYTGGVLPGSAVVKLPVFGASLKMANQQSLGVINFTRFTKTPTVFLQDKDGRILNDAVVKSKVDYVLVPGAVVHGISDVLLPKL